MDEPFAPSEKLQLSMLRAEHQKRYQMTIEFVKERLGEGTEHVNEIGRLVTSPNGASCELTDLPEEFCAGLGPGVNITYLEENAIAPLLQACCNLLLPENIALVRRLRVTMFYSRRGLLDSRNCYCVDYPDSQSSTGAPRVIGAYKADSVPLFFRITCDAEESPIPGLCETGQFMLFGIVTRSRLNPVVVVPYDGGQLTDISVPQRSPIPD